MEIHKIDNTRPCFGAKLVNSAALDKYTAGLPDAQRIIFDERRKLIESVKDGKEFIYSVIQAPVKVVSIMEITKSGDSTSFLPRYSGYEENTDSLFELLYKEYKSLASKLLENKEKETVKKINVVL